MEENHNHASNVKTFINYHYYITITSLHIFLKSKVLTENHLDNQ